MKNWKKWNHHAFKCNKRSNFTHVLIIKLLCFSDVVEICQHRLANFKDEDVNTPVSLKFAICDYTNNLKHE